MDEERSGMLTLAIIGIVLILLGIAIIFNSVTVEYWFGVFLGLLPAIAGTVLMRKLF
ncbi:hypothetical protein ACT17S_07210 [Glutamicibacter mysorens]